MADNVKVAVESNESQRDVIQRFQEAPMSWSRSEGISTANLDELMDAFKLVPSEYRGGLRAYFEASPGRYALGAFLDQLSDWWVSSGTNLSTGGTRPNSRSLAGVWHDDPTCPNVLNPDTEE
jgi:hypothetical protein